MASNPGLQLELGNLSDPADEPPPVETSRRARKRVPGPWRPRLRLAGLIAGAMVALLGALWGFYQVDQFLATYPRFVLPASAYSRPASPDFRIEGAAYVTREDIVHVFAQDFGRSVHLVPLDERRRALMAIDWVREASVARRWPNRLAIRISERTPVAFAALAPTAAGGKAQLPHELALIDASGVILRIPSSGDFPLPVLFGLKRNQELAVRRARIGLMLDLLEELAEFAGRISEVDVTDPENLKIMFNIEGRAARLMLGPPAYLSKLKNFVRHYPEISRRLPNAVMFDLRLENRITAVEGTGNGR